MVNCVMTFHSQWACQEFDSYCKLQVSLHQNVIPHQCLTSYSSIKVKSGNVKSLWSLWSARIQVPQTETSHIYGSFKTQQLPIHSKKPRKKISALVMFFGERVAKSHCRVKVQLRLLSLSWIWFSLHPSSTPRLSL